LEEKMAITATKKKGLFAWYFNTNLLTRILIGMVLGIVAGMVFGKGILWVGPFGDILVRLLKMIVMPVVIFTLVVGAASIHPSRLGRIGIKALAWYMFTSAIAVAIGLACGNLFRPGSGMSLGDVGAAAGKTLTQPSLLDTFMAIIPTNPFESVTSGNILAVIFSSIMFGMALAHLRENKKERIRNAAATVFSFFEGCAEIMYKVVQWVLEYAPIGVFALIAVVFAKQGAQAFGPLATITASVYIGLAVHLLVVYCSMVALYGINPLQFLIRIREAFVTAFVTRSSGATLPVSMEVADEKLGVSKGVYSFTLPLGATINMDGTAIYQGVCAVFVGLAIGMPLTFNQQLTVIATAVLASIGTAGVPGAGAIMLLLVLDSVGLKVEPGSAVAAAYAMILGIDALLDMGRTGMNVAGDLAVTTVVAKSEGELDPAVWDAPALGARAGEAAEEA
jgi:Na+/H+-dicarboxylate symporter